MVSIDGPLPSVMQEVDLPIINNTMCEKMYRDAGYVEHIPNIFICAGYAAGGKDSCEVSIFMECAIKLINRIYLPIRE